MGDGGQETVSNYNNRFAALENFSDSKDISRAWGNIKENAKTSANDSPSLYELKQN
jgi:hypothetical protein